MRFELVPLAPANVGRFKKDMQEAFQQGAADSFGDCQEEILPESHIERSLNAEGSAAYEAFAEGESAGGAVVVIDRTARHGHLDFLYVKNGAHDKGIGFAIWDAIEKMYPEIQVWETVTPYFEKRNIHFYVNKCGFRIVEFYNKHHKDPNDDTQENDCFEGMFRFEKYMT